MSTSYKTLVVLASFLSLASTSIAAAGEQCCKCGACRNLKKICVPVPVEKEVTEVCWSVKCEDFCVPGPSKCCGTVHECDECGPWCRTIWQPGCCACVRTRRTPVKKEVTRKVPTIKWEVQTVCCDCCATLGDNYKELTAGQKLMAQLQNLSIGGRGKNEKSAAAQPAMKQSQPAAGDVPLIASASAAQGGNGKTVAYAKSALPSAGTSQQQQSQADSTGPGYRY